MRYHYAKPVEYSTIYGSTYPNRYNTTNNVGFKNETLA